MGPCRKGNWSLLGAIEMRMHQSSSYGYRVFAIIILALIILPGISNAAIHFGTGLGYYNGEYIYYNDKGYYENFSTELDVYSNLDNTHLVFLNIHLYSELSRSVFGATPILYGGLGGVFSKNAHKNSPNGSGGKWGLRSPFGIELMTASGISMFAEIAPTYIPSLNNEIAMTNAFGIRYYFY